MLAVRVASLASSCHRDARRQLYEPRNSCTSLQLPALDSRRSVKIAEKIKEKEIRMRDKSPKACQFVSLLIRFACVAILFLVTSAIPMTNQAQTQQQRKPTGSVPMLE